MEEDHKVFQGEIRRSRKRSPRKEFLSSLDRYACHEVNLLREEYSSPKKPYSSEGQNLMGILGSAFGEVYSRESDDRINPYAREREFI